MLTFDIITGNDVYLNFLVGYVIEVDFLGFGSGFTKIVSGT